MYGAKTIVTHVWYEAKTMTHVWYGMGQRQYRAGNSQTPDGLQHTLGALAWTAAQLFTQVHFEYMHVTDLPAI